MNDAATKTEYKHFEAFMHMWYATDDGRERELIWNSRDGVTPFCERSRSGKEMTHVNWNQDSREPGYKPKAGDRIFVDATRELLGDAAKAYVEKYWDNPEYPMSKMTYSWKTKEEAVEYFLAEWTKPGSPTLVEVQEDGTYKHAA